MTREESVIQLNDLLDYCKQSGEEWAKDTEALEMAINALEHEKIGYWEKSVGDCRTTCPFCHVLNFSKYKNFCPNCGALLKKR